MGLVKKIIINMYMLFRRLVSNNCKAVLFISFNGKSYSDNPRAISEKLHELYPDIEIRWAFLEPTKKKIVPNYVRIIDLNNKIEYFDSLACAKVFVTNFNIPMMLKGKKQMFIQTWHGDKAFKKVLYDSGFVGNKFKISEEKQGFCDYAIAGSEYGVNQYRSAFRYKGEILNVGTPRNDKLVNKEIEQAYEIKNSLKLNDVRILLYAPTLRRENNIHNKAMCADDLNVVDILNYLKNRDSCEWICLLRAHPGICDLYVSSDDSRIINVSEYEDMADLLLISDMLITDYSSCAGDFALLDRPVILFQPDRNEYIEKDRSFYFDIDESPYMVAQSMEEILRILKDLNEEKIKKNCMQILGFYGNTETGKSSENIANIINDWITKK